MELTINVPRQIDASEFDIKMCLASKLYEDGRASLGCAAEVAGLSKPAFTELFEKYKLNETRSPKNGTDFSDVLNVNLESMREYTKNDSW